MTAVLDTSSVDRVGSPVVDADFVARRQRQRLVFRTIPDWIVAEVVADGRGRDAAAALASHPDADLMEVHLRDVIDRLVGQLRLALDDMAEGLVATAAQTLYDVAGDGDLDVLRFERDRAGSRPAAAKYMGDVREFRRLPEIDHESVAALIVASTWADVLAGDYVDPRTARR